MVFLHKAFPLLRRQSQQRQCFCGSQIGKRLPICPFPRQPHEVAGGTLRKLDLLRQPGQPLPMRKHGLGLDQPLTDTQDSVAGILLQPQDLGSNDPNVPHGGRLPRSLRIFGDIKRHGAHLPDIPPPTSGSPCPRRSADCTPPAEPARRCSPGLCRSGGWVS